MQVEIVKFVAGHVICHLVNMPGWGTHPGIMPDICGTAAMYICNDLGGEVADNISKHASQIKHEVSTYCIRTDTVRSYQVALVVFQHFIVETPLIQQVTPEMRVQVFKDIWDAAYNQAPAISNDAKNAYTSQPRANMSDDWFNTVGGFVKDYKHSTEFTPSDIWDEKMAARVEVTGDSIAANKDFESVFRAQQLLIGYNAIRLMAIEKELQAMRKQTTGDAPAKKSKPGEGLYIIHDNARPVNTNLMESFGDSESHGMRNAYHGYPFGRTPSVESGEKLLEMINDIEKKYGGEAFQRTFVQGSTVHFVVDGLLNVVKSYHNDIVRLKKEIEEGESVFPFKTVVPFPFDMITSGDRKLDDSDISDDVKDHISGNYHIFYSVKDLMPAITAVTVNEVISMVRTTLSSSGRHSFYSDALVKLLVAEIEKLREDAKTTERAPSNVLDYLALTISGNEYTRGNELPESIATHIIRDGGAVDAVLPTCCSKDALTMQNITDFVREHRHPCNTGYRFYSEFMVDAIINDYLRLQSSIDELRRDIDRLKKPKRTTTTARSKNKPTPKKGEN